MDNDCIRTRSGIDVNLREPKPEMIDPRDIAWALGRIPRFVGHTSSAIPLSVAQHSIAVADEAARRFKARAKSIDWSVEIVGLCRLVSLLHDAPEAYIGDIPTPVKKLLGAKIIVIESKLAGAIWERLGATHRPADGVYYQIKSAVHEADEAALVTEMTALLGAVPRELQGVEPCWQYRAVHQPWTSSEATIQYYGALRRAVNAGTGDDIGDLVPEGGALPLVSDPMDEADAEAHVDDAAR